MIVLKRITSYNTYEYCFTENLLTNSFPKDEYRNLEEQRNNVVKKANFHLMLACENGEPVGFISYWMLDDFCYVEHLATLNQLRGKGYGKSILNELQKMVEKIVLEVEIPIDELSRRRIDFYRRAGFILCEVPYVQPSYRANGKSLPMLLMFYGWDCNKSNYEKAKKQIYNNIYQYKEE